MIPRRKRRPKMGLRVSTKVVCHSHGKWIRGHQCLIAGLSRKKNGEHHECWGRIEAHHTTTRGAGGDDSTLVPLCSGAHALLDSPGWSQPYFESEYGVNLKATAAALWKHSPHRVAYEKKHGL
jgi:hypothetical protein